MSICIPNSQDDSRTMCQCNSPCGEHKLRNFKARYLTMKQTIREYSCLGNLAQLI
jgi:hypothetical protein